MRTFISSQGITGAISNSPIIITNSGTTKTLGWPTGQGSTSTYNITLTSNCDFSATSITATPTQTIYLFLRQDSSGNRTATFNGTPLPLSTSSGSIDVYEIYSFDGGVTAIIVPVVLNAISVISTIIGLNARFSQNTATAGTSATATALFSSMTPVSGNSNNRNGSITTTNDPTKYTWVAVLASAAGSGMHFFDGTGFGGFNGANSTSVYTGPDSDPTVIFQTYTDISGNVWNLYRSSGHSVALTFTLS